MLKPLAIVPQSLENRYAPLLWGAGGWILLLLYNLLELPQNGSLNFIVGAACGIAILVGILKLSEPPQSFLLNPEGLVLTQRKGSVFIPWQAILRVGEVSLGQGFNRQELPFVGIRLKQPLDMVKAVPLRLASHWLSEQRALVGHIMRHAEPEEGSAVPRLLLFESDVFRCRKTKVQLSGIQAMLAHRMALFRQHLGYDWVIHASLLDRDVTAFAAFLRDYHQQALALQSAGTDSKINDSNSNHN